jgi:hypothetical protein
MVGEEAIEKIGKSQNSQIFQPPPVFITSQNSPVSNVFSPLVGNLKDLGECGGISNS